MKRIPVCALLAIAVSLAASRRGAAQDAVPRSPTFLAGGSRLDREGLPEMLSASAGSTVDLSFYYTSPEDDLPGVEQFDHLQGFSMVLCYDCRLTSDDTTFRVASPSIASALGVEFVAFRSEGREDDGDGCEMSFAMLVEAVPPFEGKTLPPTSEPLRLATVELGVDGGVACGETLEIDFCDGVDISGRVPLHNVYSAENRSFAAATRGTGVVIDSTASFRRGDCNWDGGFHISDAIAVLNAVFFQASFGFRPLCEDACDANDDGRLDLADTMTLLRWLFLRGTPPAAPGILAAGLDPTDDRLECALPCP